MGTIAKGEITLCPVNDAYTVSITPASCTIKADFDGSNPQLDNAKGTITIKRGTRDVPFHVVAPHISTGGSVTFANQTSSIVAFEVTSLPSNVLNGIVGFDIKTDDGFDYQTTVQFAFTIVRESTMLDWIKDWEGSKTKVGGTYIMTPKLFVGKKEDICHEIENESADGYEVTTEWIPGALTGVYIGPDLLSNGESSVGIYGYLKDEQIFHINADGGFIGGWAFNEAGLQSSNGIVNILAEGSIFAQNPNSTIPYWGIYADGHAAFANGNVKFLADGSAEFAGKITSTSGKIGGWTLSQNQLQSNRIILDSTEGYIGINASESMQVDIETGDFKFPVTPEGGIKLWYTSASDFGMAAWTASNKVFQLGALNMIAGWNFNHQAIWTGSDSPYLSQGAFAANSGELTMAPNGIRSNKWYIDANGTAQFVGGSVQFNAENAEMFGWKMRTGRFSASHAALVSDSSNNGIYVSPADLTEISSSSLRNTICNNGGIYIWSDAVDSILCAYDKSGNLGFALRTNGCHSIGNWYFNHQSLYIGSDELSSNGFTLDSGSMVLASSGIYGFAWKLKADGSGSLAGGKINWDAEGNLNVDAKISANNITAGTISTAAIKNGDYWGLNLDGSGYLAASNITWDKDGELSIEGKIVANSGSIAGFTISNGHIGVDSTADGSPSGSQSDWANLSIYKDFFKVGGSKGYVMFGDDVIPTSVGGAFTAVGRIVNNAPNNYGSYGFDQANYGLFIDVSGGTKNYGISSNAALKAPAFINTEAQILTFSSGTYSVDFSQHTIFLLYYNNPNYSGTEVNLPSESSVASQFGLSELPDNFAIVLTFRVRTGSQNITLKGIYNHNESSTDYTLGPGDSVQVLVSKIDGFRYQILNHTA